MTGHDDEVLKPSGDIRRAEGFVPIEMYQRVCVELRQLRSLVDRPAIADFATAVKLEAAHARDRFGADHDLGKAPWDWFWTLAHPASKCVHALLAGDVSKALHHTVSSAALLANWHADIAAAHPEEIERQQPEAADGA